MKQLYLGDGLYAVDHGHQIELHAEQPQGMQRVFLDDSTLETFMQFVELARNVKITTTRKPKLSHGATEYPPPSIW